ncbi:L-arabinose isomerase [Friedmanniella endophytica]|uniref:L-arabinose isomerase n=1 Tax=Microlunatus kandeliicorticis TaxID=1759536 RepID=A0A7W3IRZ2_9ACTN|nr:L-arabinose isomerase [Microlunatus kandeliicorticis]MBA8794151.1 L-arabinose isomerase [Microlunatus kandeliicorticis]
MPATCWFLTGSQGLYGPEVVAQVEQQSRQIVERLSEGGLPVPVVWKPVLTSAGDIHRVMLEANADPDCIGLIAWMHTFSPAKMWITGLDALRTPLLHLHTQANESLPWSEIDMDFMNLNQAAHGDREFGYIQTRLGVPRKTVVGFAGDSRVLARITSWQRAALGAAAVRSLKLARFGDNMRDVAVTEGDKVEAQLRLGVSVNTWGVNDLVERVDATTDAQVDELVDDYLDSYEVVSELRPGGDRHESLRYSAKIEAGLRSFLTEGGFGAFTTNFEDLGGLRQLPGMAVQRLMAEGYGFGGEGDWKTSVMLHTIKAMTPEGGPTSFMEDYTYHLGPGRQKILGAHMLEVCPSIAAAKPRVEIHPLGIGNREDPVRLVFDARPGDGVVLGICDLGDRFRLVLNEIEVTPSDEPLPKLPVARAVWEPKPDLPTSAECWISAGGPHHTVLSEAIGTEEIADLAEILGTELVVIDADTTPRRFRDELRWSAAYHRLAARL